MSHPAEGKRIFDAGWRKQMASALVRAVVNYQKLTEPPRPANLPVTNRPAIKTPPAKRSS